MSSLRGVAKKTCAVCGTDISDKPRVRDAHGRYGCKGQCERGLSALPAATPKPVDNADIAIMNGLVSTSVMATAVPCQGCSNPLPAGTVVCVRCGHNASTGKAIKTRITSEKAPRSSGGAKGPAFKLPDGALGTFLLFVIASAVCCLPAVVVLLDPGSLFLMYVAIAGVAIVIGLWAIVRAFLAGDTIWGIIALIPGVQIAFLFWVFFINEDRRLKAWYFAPFFGGVALGVAAVVSGGDIASISR